MLFSFTKLEYKNFSVTMRKNPMHSYIASITRNARIEELKTGCDME